jgi:hypothetical protein
VKYIKKRRSGCKKSSAKRYESALWKTRSAIDDFTPSWCRANDFINRFEDALAWRQFYPSVTGDCPGFSGTTGAEPRIEVAGSELNHSVHPRATATGRSHDAPGFINGKWIKWILWRSCIEN